MKNIDWLKSNHSMIHFFGLGFIQIKLKDSKFRVHCYSTKYNPIVSDDSIHNHRYLFSSFILKGCLKHTVYNFVPNELGTHIKKYESCSEFKKNNLPCIIGNIIPQIEIVHKIKDIYTIFPETFHKITAYEDTITIIKRNDYEKEFAEVIHPKNTNEICPFSLKIDEKELWDVVEFMLNDVDNLYFEKNIKLSTS